jgi:Glycosyl hydrolases family 2
MSNRIRQFRVLDRSLTPNEAEVWVFVEAESMSAKTEVRGRLMGPSCPYASTVDVAYPLRLFPKWPEGFSPLTRRVIIPEPSLWDTVSPHLYQGVVELWEDGQLCDRVSVRHGLRAIQLDAFGLRWNGKPMRLHAVEWDRPTIEGLAELRSTGANMLLVPGAAKEVWAEAERIGLLVLARVSEPDVKLVQPSPACLGWVVPGSAMKGWLEWKEWSAAVHKARQLVGVELSEYLPNWKLPPDVRFAVSDDTLPSLPQRPRLMRSLFEQATADAELGWLDESPR